MLLLVVAFSALAGSSSEHLLQSHSAPLFVSTATSELAERLTSVAPTVVLTSSPTTYTAYLPLIFGPPPTKIVIAAAHIDSAISGEADEALLLWNVDDRTQPLAGWQIRTATRSASFPLTSTVTLAPGTKIWCAAASVTFTLSFGEPAACEWIDTDAAVPDLDGNLALTNRGGIVQLLSPEGILIDTLVYGEETRPTAGWHGVAAQLYSRGDIPREGQIWHRKLEPQSGLSIDTDQAVDWSGDLTDLAWGRQVWLPGWAKLTTALSARIQPVSATATLTVAIGPEGLYQPLASLLSQAEDTLDLSLYTLEHQALTAQIAATAKRGVVVRLLLEGSPPGGISDYQKWCVSQIVEAGGDVRYLAALDEAPNGYRPRYRFSHAKYGIVDGRIAFNGTENFGMDSMPLPAATAVGGRRGFYLITDATPIVTALQTIFATDWAPERFLDLYPYTPSHEKYGGPPADFTIPTPVTYPVTAAPFAVPVAAHGVGRFQIVSAPEDATQPTNGLHALIARAGAGDAIHVMQLYEHKHWGATTSNPVADPNPRLLALIDAARRGAQVTMLLDSYFDDADSLRSNQATVDYLNLVATTEGVPLRARVGNPTLGGIHAKLFLLQIGDERWSAVGSLNGSEVSHKLNREVVVLTDMAAIYQRLLEVFLADWEN